MVKKMPLYLKRIIKQRLNSELNSGIHFEALQTKSCGENGKILEFVNSFNIFYILLAIYAISKFIGITLRNIIKYVAKIL